MKNLSDGTHLIDHSVTTPEGVVPGFLVRTASGREMGVVWLQRGRWQWRSPTGNHYGERVTKLSAVETLRDAFNIKNRISTSSAPAQLPLIVIDVEPHPKRQAKPKAPAFKQDIVWGPESAPAADIREHLSAAFKKAGAK